MSSVVYFGSAHQAHLEAKETLPAKLDIILEKLHLRERVKDELVAIKMHVGNNINYSTIHPVFVRKVVKAIKDGGGTPFVVDVNWDVEGAETRGYTNEILGCPVYPNAGLKDNYYFLHTSHPYKNIKEWKVAGMIEEATFMVDFAHIKGHPSCGFGGCFKNIALGCMVGETRSQMHDTVQQDKYWFKELCPDEATRKKIIQSCPFEALVEDKEDPMEIHLHTEPCNQCMRCLKVAPKGSLKIDPINFFSFQEACAHSTAVTLSTFAPGKTTFLALAIHQSPLCDCFGFTTLPILPDVGIFGSDDIVAIDSAVLDEVGKTKLLLENVPACIEVNDEPVHPYAQLHGIYKDPYKVVEVGETLGLGSRTYELVDIMPIEEKGPRALAYIKARK